jgi:hypothetical protein
MRRSRTFFSQTFTRDTTDLCLAFVQKAKMSKIDPPYCMRDQEYYKKSMVRKRGGGGGGEGRCTQDKILIHFC